MDLIDNLKWMFFGSIVIGIFFNAMNILAYRSDDLYLSTTLIYSALFMASNMCILEILMYYNHSNEFKLNLFIYFIIFSIFMIVVLREQFLVDDEQWLRRMIGHHSTALTTSHKIYAKTKNEEVKKLAADIIVAQEKEIKIMKGLLQKNYI